MGAWTETKTRTRQKLESKESGRRSRSVVPRDRGSSFRARGERFGGAGGASRASPRGRRRGDDGGDGRGRARFRRRRRRGRRRGERRSCDRGDAIARGDDDAVDAVDAVERARGVFFASRRAEARGGTRGEAAARGGPRRENDGSPRKRPRGGARGARAAGARDDAPDAADAKPPPRRDTRDAARTRTSRGRWVWKGYALRRTRMRTRTRKQKQKRIQNPRGVRRARVASRRRRQVSGAARDGGALGRARTLRAPRPGFVSGFRRRRCERLRSRGGRRRRGKGGGRRRRGKVGGRRRLGRARRRRRRRSTRRRRSSPRARRGGCGGAGCRRRGPRGRAQVGALVRRRPGARAGTRAGARRARGGFERGAGPRRKKTTPPRAFRPRRRPSRRPPSRTLASPLGSRRWWRGVPSSARRRATTAAIPTTTRARRARASSRRVARSDPTTPRTKMTRRDPGGPAGFVERAMRTRRRARARGDGDEPRRRGPFGDVRRLERARGKPPASETAVARVRIARHSRSRGGSRTSPPGARPRRRRTNEPWRSFGASRTTSRTPTSAGWRRASSAPRSTRAGRSIGRRATARLRRRPAAASAAAGRRAAEACEKVLCKSAKDLRASHPAGGSKPFKRREHAFQAHVRFLCAGLRVEAGPPGAAESESAATKAAKATAKVIHAVTFLLLPVGVAGLRALVEEDFAPRYAGTVPRMLAKVRAELGVAAKNDGAGSGENDGEARGGGGGSGKTRRKKTGPEIFSPMTRAKRREASGARDAEPRGGELTTIPGAPSSLAGADRTIPPPHGPLAGSRPPPNPANPAAKPGGGAGASKTAAWHPLFRGRAPRRREVKMRVMPPPAMPPPGAPGERRLALPPGPAANDRFERGPPGERPAPSGSSMDSERRRRGPTPRRLAAEFGATPGSVGTHAITPGTAAAIAAMQTPAPPPGRRPVPAVNGGGGLETPAPARAARGGRASSRAAWKRPRRRRRRRPRGRGEGSTRAGGRTRR